VRRVEPAGFTKLSALGIEQQRVNVLVALKEPPPALGVGYRLQARFITARHESALIVPRASVLQAPDHSYYVFAVKGGRLEQRAIELGLQNDLEIEITGGLSEGERVVRAPDTSLQPGARVQGE